MSLINHFLIGADPEFVLMNQEHLCKLSPAVVERYDPWGLDHGGWVVESHPEPALSVRELMRNIRVSMNDFALKAPNFKWQSGAFIQSPERNVSLGGHIHVDLPKCPPDVVKGLDLFDRHLEDLDILPREGCDSRRTAVGYGQFGDVREEHGHFEYRTFPSWLYSQRITKICLVGTKLIVVAPGVVVDALGNPNTASIGKLKKFFEYFKGKDDDVDWILDRGTLDVKLSVKPDRDLRSVWRVTPKKENPNWKQMKAQKSVLGSVIAPNGIEDIVYPYVRRISGHYFYNLNSPGTPLSISQQLLVQDAITNRLPTRLVIGPWYPGNLSLYVAGTPDDDSLFSDITFAIPNKVCHFGLLRLQQINSRTREILESIARSEVPGTVGLINGLYFKYIS